MLNGVFRFYQSFFSGKSFMQWAPCDNGLDAYTAKTNKHLKCVIQFLLTKVILTCVCRSVDSVFQIQCEAAAFMNSLRQELHVLEKSLDTCID